MTRTIVSLPEADKRWLMKVGKENHKSMTAVIREAVAFYRKSSESSPKNKSVNQALESTFGIGKGYFGDSVKYVRRLRDEWK
jgi:hypothetical protein